MRSGHRLGCPGTPPSSRPEQPLGSPRVPVSVALQGGTAGAVVIPGDDGMCRRGGRRQSRSRQFRARRTEPDAVPRMDQQQVLAIRVLMDLQLPIKSDNHPSGTGCSVPRTRIGSEGAMGGPRAAGSGPASLTSPIGIVMGDPARMVECRHGELKPHWPRRPCRFKSGSGHPLSPGPRGRAAENRPSGTAAGGMRRERRRSLPSSEPAHHSPSVNRGPRALRPAPRVM